MTARHVEEKLANEASLRWLSLLFFETLLLLFVQIVLGIVGGSLALLADSAHSAVDVVTYGFNYWIEWTKGRSSDYASVFGLQVEPWKVDAGGSMISLAALLIATTYVVVKALRLLQGDHDDVMETRAQYQLRGSVLFYFAVLSTFGNVFVLVMYQRWHPQHGSLAKSRGRSLELKQLTTGATDDSGACVVAGATDDSGSFELSSALSCGECEPSENGSSPMSRPMSPMSPGKRSRFAFKLERHCSDSNCNSPICQQEPINRPAPEHGDTPMCDVCEPSDDTPSLSQSCSSPSLSQSCSSPNCDHNYVPGNLGNSESGNLALLHTLVHPGCHAGCDHHTESSGRGEQSNHNFNVTSAMLHLISDILRGITIFVVAILIEMRVVKNSIKADTVCALLVAGLILIGALALFQKVFSFVFLDVGLRQS